MTSKKKTILIVVGCVALVGIAKVGYDVLTYESTDNAEVQAHYLMLASRVPGTVQEVNVEENQKVKAGTVLVKIDSRDTFNYLRQAQGEMGSVKAQLADAQVKFQRMAVLYKDGAVTKQQYDDAKASLDGLTKKYESASAQADQAKLNLGYTDIVAPTDGTVAKKSVEPGMIVPMGQPLLGFVEGGSRWIVANFKETQIPDIHVGNPAEVTVDAIPGRVFRGEVESISPSTGAIFSLLPPDNATGNFTKVVQRVPVRIKLFDLTSQDIDVLQAGLSAYVSVKVR